MPSTSEGQSSGDPGGYVYRDRDPPPSWNGSTPEVSFKTWLRDLELWEATTDIPKEKRAIKLVQALTGPAREAVSSLTLAELQHADGYKTVMKVLNDNFKPYVETALPRAMEGVFYGQARGAKESIPDYLVRASHALAELKAEGVDLPAKAAGYLLFRQANLDKELESRVVTWLAGDYTKDVVIANLRRLDRINSSSSGSKAMLWTETEEGEGQEVYYENHEHYGEPEFYLEAEDEEDENYVYLEDGELDAVYEEGGNGHMNWFHCNLCKARWKLSPRTAGALTGRPVETVNQSKEKTLNLAENALKQQEKRMAQKHQVEMGNLMQQLADERARSDELQTTLDLREGEYLEFERAVENVTAMEAHLSEMDPTTANQVQAMVSEFKRVQRYEQETRHRANTLPLRETKSDWEQAVATMKQAVDMVNQFYARMMTQRTQVAKQLAGM